MADSPKDVFVAEASTTHWTGKRFVTTRRFSPSLSFNTDGFLLAAVPLHAWPGYSAPTASWRVPAGTKGSSPSSADRSQAACALRRGRMWLPACVGGPLAGGRDDEIDDRIFDVGIGSQVASLRG